MLSRVIWKYPNLQAISGNNIDQKRFSWDLIDYPRDFGNTNKKFVMEF